MNRSFTLAESESSYKKYVLGVLGLKTFDLNVFNQRSQLEIFISNFLKFTLSDIQTDIESF